MNFSRARWSQHSKVVIKLQRMHNRLLNAQLRLVTSSCSLLGGVTYRSGERSAAADAFVSNHGRRRPQSGAATRYYYDCCETRIYRIMSEPLNCPRVTENVKLRESGSVEARHIDVKFTSVTQLVRTRTRRTNGSICLTILRCSVRHHGSVDISLSM